MNQNVNGIYSTIVCLTQGEGTVEGMAGRGSPPATQQTHGLARQRRQWWVGHLTLSLRNFWHPFSRSVQNYFVDARKNHGYGYKNWYISRLLIWLDIKYVHNWICE